MRSEDKRSDELTESEEIKRIEQIGLDELGWERQRREENEREE